MNEQIAARLDDFVQSGWNIKDYNGYVSWIGRVEEFLKVVDPSVVKGIVALKPDSIFFAPSAWKTSRERQISHLEGLAIKYRSPASASRESATQSIPAPPQGVGATRRVFVVHGHDVSMKESTARFLEKLELDPVILHEQPNEGSTIIEKFESKANVGFAVVLLTPDDVGACAETPNDLKSRARQNVVLELGYFIGKLGRKRVCGLVRPGVEVPSDVHGVLFIGIDPQGSWRTTLARELKAAGMKINLQALL